MIALLLAGCARGPAPDVSADPVVADAEATVAAQRRALRAHEQGLVLQRARAALEAGDTAQALVAIRMGLELDPETFGPLADQVAESATTADEHALLAEAFAADPERARAHRERAEALAIVERWAPEAREGSLAWTEDITPEMGRIVLDRVVAEYVVAPDLSAMNAAAGDRLGAVAAAWALPAPDPADTVAGAVEAAVAVGLPEAVAVMEGVDAALAALDPYTRAVWPAELASWEQHHAGVVVGVGLELIDAPDGSVLVKQPVPDSPAWEAGVHQADAVRAVIEGAERHDVAALATPRSEAVEAALAGEEGSTVTVEVVREDALLTFDLTRAPVPVPTVFGWTREPDNRWSTALRPGVAFVRIEAFRSTTDEDVRALLEGTSPSGVILDLRGNGGGDVSAAVNVADLFVPDGELAHLAGRTATEPELEEGEVAWNQAIAGDPLEGVPVVVLVDGVTASAAEILAGALRERAGALLVGTPTFGKGLSQALRSNEAGTFGWQVTNLMWTLPSGTPVEPPGEGEGGLAPDLEVVLTPAERFQVDVMRRQREALRSHPDGTPMQYLGTVRSADLPPLSADPVVIAGLEVLEGLGGTAVSD